MPIVPLDLSDEAVARLRAEVVRRGISLEAVVNELAMTLPAPGATSLPKKFGFVALGRSTSGRSAADADEMLAEGFGRD